MYRARYASDIFYSVLKNIAFFVFVILVTLKLVKAKL